MALSAVFKEINKLRNKGSGDLRARSHLAKFPTCRKTLKKSLELGVVGTLLIPALGRQRLEDF